MKPKSFFVFSSFTGKMSLWLKVAGCSGAMAIAMGAFGSHGLKNKVDPALCESSTCLNYFT